MQSTLEISWWDKIIKWIRTHKGYTAAYAMFALIMLMLIAQAFFTPKYPDDDDGDDDDDIDITVNNSFSLLNTNSGEKKGLFNK